MNALSGVIYARIYARYPDISGSDLILNVILISTRSDLYIVMACAVIVTGILRELNVRCLSN